MSNDDKKYPLTSNQLFKLGQIYECLQLLKDNPASIRNRHTNELIDNYAQDSNLLPYKYLIITLLELKNITIPSQIDKALQKFFSSIDVEDNNILFNEPVPSGCQEQFLLGKEQWYEILKENPIRQKRIAKGLTQKELADMLNVKQKDISRWENEQHEPSLKHLKALAKVFNCPMEDLWIF